MKLEPIELGSVLQVAKGKKPARQSEKCEEGFLPYVDIRAFEQGAVSQYTDGEKCLPCEDGDILIVCDGARSGLVGRAIKGYVGSTLALLRARGVCNSYLFHFIASKYALLNTKMKGTGTPHLNMDVLKKQKIVVPSIEDQERIVSKIEELFSEIDNAVSSLNVVKQKLTAYRHAVYTSAFASFQDRVPLTDYFDISSGITKNPARSKLKIQMPYLRVANVYYNKLDLSEIKKIGVEKNEIAKNLLKSGDLLFVEGNGSKSQIGRVAIWDGSIPDCLHQNHIIKARVQREISVRFVLYYLMSEHGRKQILKVATSSSGLYTLSANKIRNIKIPFCPIEEQQRAVSLIEEKLSSCDMIANTICQIFQQAKALKQSVLKSAFEGTLL